MDYGKLSTELAVALEDFRTHDFAALARRRTSGVVSAARPAPDAARVVVFVQIDPDADVDRLAVLGMEVNSGEGPVRTGIVRLDALEALTADPAVHRIVPAQQLRPRMDVAQPAVGVPTFRDREGLSGKGVVVGVVDTGVEARHPALAGRIQSIWDQTLPGPGVPEGGYGVELTGPMMETSRDTVGHGTHCAGVAAGADANYPGVAPEATLVIVKSDLLTAHVADGVRYVSRVASDLGMPAVVILGMGGHGDAHDGTDPLSQVIDASVGPGRVVCCAAGNEGDDNIHAEIVGLEGGTRTITCAVNRPAIGQPTITAAFSGWYPRDDLVSVAVAGPSQEQTPFQPVIGDGSPVRGYELADGVVRVATPEAGAGGGDAAFLVEIQPAPAPPGQPSRETWLIRLRGDRVVHGRVDVWTVDEAVATFTGPAAGHTMKIGSPGAATRAVTVASYTTRVEWFDVMGGAHLAGLDPGDISTFSSGGPRRDGVEKPDVVAPGAMVASALSVHSGVALAVLVDDQTAIKASTSVAASFVAGLVALMLQR
ncbi:MAG: S8 family serine peptidase, partial [Actinomycetota bacterium]|nr:S8 family serine peptidase [Actinomycetota bacterium]